MISFGDKRPSAMESRIARTPTWQPSTVCCSLQDFVAAMKVLTILKRTTAFTTEQAAGWYAALAHFRHTTINRAVLQLSASQDRFPELSDLFQLCRKIEPPTVPYAPNGDGCLKPIYSAEIEAIAARLRLEV